MQKDCDSSKEKGTLFHRLVRYFAEMECVKEDVKEGKGFYCERCDCFYDDVILSRSKL